MASAIEQLVIDPQSRFLEMKSLQPYSTRDEYLYAMKEDLADWLSNMYPDWQPITAENFLQCLENGVLLCHHANNVNDAARKVSSISLLTDCKYRSDARPQTFNARDNISQFIKWARRVAGVREVLMFESDDLILRKNEKNFLLCLLEIARFGARFGVSVPAIIKLEDEIEREIERDRQTNKFLVIELQRLQTEHEDETKTIQSIDEIERDRQTEKFSVVESQRPQIEQEDEKKIIQSIDENQVNQSSIEYQTSTNSDAVHWLEQQQITQVSDEDGSHQWESSEDKLVPNEELTTVVRSDEEPELSRTVDEENRQAIVPPVSSSHLHKTVVKITNSCCCSQRFPVIQIGEGKYRIGQNGTIIFIRILRNHVMVRVGGGWDTLENYLNKHDPCRRSGTHHRNGHHHHHNSEIPILAMPNTNVSSSVQKNTPFGKSITIKTEEYPLPKPSIHDTNLVDAQLVITRGVDGRHRIGQITYKSEEDTLNQPPACPHHHHHHQSSSPSPSPSKTRTIRNTGRLTPSSVYTKQSSPSTDQDYSSFTEPTTPSKPSPSSSFEFKEELLEQPLKSLNLTTTKTRPVHSSPVHRTHPKPMSQHITNKNLSITESIIGNIDGYTPPTSIHMEQDFDISDIEDVMDIKKNASLTENTIDMDNDSLESSEGVLDERKEVSPAKKPSGYVSAFYLAEKQKFQEEQAANRRRASTTLNRYSSRSATLSNVFNDTKKEEQVSKPRRKMISATQRSQSSDLIDKNTDISKLDRDSGFDEQDFRRERLNSNGDDNLSICSMKSARSSTISLEIRQNKSYELRMKKLDANRTSLEKGSPFQARRNVNSSSSSSRRGSELIPPTPPSNKHRKTSQPIVQLTVHAQNERVNL